MAYDVTGSHNGVAYKVSVGDDGQATGSQSILGALTSWAGDTVLASPTGPAYTVAAGDPVSMYAALAARTVITMTGGDVPPIVPPVRIGATY